MEPDEAERFERVDREVVPLSRTIRRTYDPRIERAVWFLVAILSALLAIRFLMKLLGASLQSDFVRFLYGITGVLVAPFNGIFQATGSGNYVFEPESLIAIAIYVLIGWAVVALIRILGAPRARPIV